MKLQAVLSAALLVQVSLYPFTLCAKRSLPRIDLLENAKKVLQLQAEIEELKAKLDSQCYGDSSNTAAQSCKDIQEKHACSGKHSGNYWILGPSNGRPMQMYCHMAGECCGNDGVYTRIAHFDMTDSRQKCPANLKFEDSPRSCWKTSSAGTCDSIIFPTHGLKYSKVCGEISAYQYGSPDGFAGTFQKSIDSAYLDGISITTHGQSPRNHIWSFAVATSVNKTTCPCLAPKEHPIAGTSFYCDRGGEAVSSVSTVRLFQENNSSPYCPSRVFCKGNCPSTVFCKNLSEPTSDDIEVRLCTDEDLAKENIGLEVVKLYIQ